MWKIRDVMLFCYVTLMLRRPTNLRHPTFLLIKPMLLGCFVCNLYDVLYFVRMHSFVRHWNTKCAAVKYRKSIKIRQNVVFHRTYYNQKEPKRNNLADSFGHNFVHVYMLLAQRFEFVHATLTPILEQSIFFFSVILFIFVLFFSLSLSVSVS